MQERRHVKTVPGEPHAVPEYTPDPVRREEGGNMQMDDINIPLVAVSVVFFAVLLVVTVVSLQAWFYNYQAGERREKTLAQDDPATELGALLQKQHKELYDPAGWARAPATVATAPGATTASRPAVEKRIPIDQAMQIIVKEYAQTGGGTGR